MRPAADLSPTEPRNVMFVDWGYANLSVCIAQVRI